MFLDRFHVLMLKTNLKKYNMLIHFQTKTILKSNSYHNTPLIYSNSFIL